MEELDENGYKKSKLSLEDLNDPRYSAKRLSASELNQWKRLHSERDTNDFIKKSIETKKSQNYYQSESHKRTSSAGGKVGGQLRKQCDDWQDHVQKILKGTMEHRIKVRHEKYTAVLDALPDEFTQKQIHDTNTALGYNKGINIRFMISNGYIEKSYNGTPGSNFDVTRYKRIQK